MKRLFFLGGLLVLCCSVKNLAQNPKPKYLFSIAGEKHYPDEFIYAFSKNNQAKKITNDSIDSYLDLYLKFRLKVLEAKILGYDTTAEFKKEFTQYKKQLDDSYLSPKGDQEALIKEAYEHSLWEIKASHILIELKTDASLEDTVKAYQKITSIRDRALQGEKFEKLARQFSEDPSAPGNGGELGYFSTLQMVYPFEKAAYSTPVGKVSAPVRTRFGYHIIKVEDKRKNEGKVQVAHIMVLLTSKDSEAKKKEAKAKIFEADSLLKAGADWNEACRNYSEDKSSVFNNGMLRPFGRGQIVPPFEVAAFSLKNPGDISEPVQTQYGWHILKLIKKIPVGSFEEERDNLARGVSRDSRSSLPKDEMLKKLKLANGFQRNEMAVESLVETNDSSLAQIADTTWLFKIQDVHVSVGDFLSAAKGKPDPKGIAAFEDSLVINYEKQHLAEKYPEYRYLVNEYYDGILLFSIMEDSVWNKSMTDTLGLETFYEKHKNNYKAYRMDTTIFNSSSEDVIDRVILQVSQDSTDWEMLKANLLEEYNISPLTLHVVSKKEAVWNQVVSALASRNSNPLKLGDTWYWVRTGKANMLLPLSEVKGKVITEYQNELDKEWVEQLRNKYPVSINKKELKKVYAHFKENK